MATTKSKAPEREPTADEAMGMKWWNGLTQLERTHVLNEADKIRGWDGKDLSKGSSPADAWALWKAGKITMTPS